MGSYQPQGLPTCWHFDPLVLTTVFSALLHRHSWVRVHPSSNSVLILISSARHLYSFMTLQSCVTITSTKSIHRHIHSVSRSTFCHDDTDRLTLLRLVMNMIHVGKTNKQEIADAIVLTFISLNFNLDLFLLFASPIIGNVGWEGMKFFLGQKTFKSHSAKAWLVLLTVSKNIG